MPRKRTPPSMRETPAARALRAAVAEAEAEMMARIPGAGKGAKKTSREVERTLAKAHAKWDAAPAAWRAKRGAKILAELRRYDKAATLPADGGREIYAVRRLHVAPVPVPDLYEGHGTPVAFVTAHEAPAPATEPEPSTDELAERRKARRRPRGVWAGALDLQRLDFDDWED